MRYRFLTFELDTERRELLGSGAPVAIPPRAFDVLAYLIAHGDRLVTKAELMDRFWAANVSEAALQKAVSQARKALGGAAAIRTRHGRGFRFVAVVSAVGQTPEDAAPTEPESPANALVAIRERRLATVLCVRFHGAEARCEGLLAQAKTVVGRYGGGLLHMMVDGFTMGFGLDPLQDDGARRAVHCAFDLAGIAADAAGVCWSFGVDSGGIAAEGGVQNGAWTLPGEIERGATVLAEAAPPGAVLASRAAREQMGDEIETTDAPLGFRILSVRAMGAGVPARPRKRAGRFVGRTAELTFLSAQRDSLLAGTGQAIVLSGPAGIGKTRLASEFLARLDAARVRTIRVQCLPTLGDTPLAPIRALCLALDAKIRTGVAADAVDAALLRELLADGAGGAPDLQALSDHQRRRRTFGLVDRLLAAAGAERPSVVLVEDVHWLDATSRDCLEYLLQDVDRKPLMAVLTTRPSEAPPPTDAVLHLSSLGRAEGLTLLRDAAGDADLEDEVADALLDRAGGNPFFIEELALAAQLGGAAAGLPATVQAVIAARVAGLRPSARALVYAVATIGRPAPPALAARLLGRPAADVAAEAEGLVRAGFLHATPESYVFRHMLIDDAAYEMVDPDDRKRLHAEIARRFEAEDEASRPERLAWHFQQAGDVAKAMAFWSKASQAALHRSAFREAAAFAERGLALGGEDSLEIERLRLDLLLRLAPALTALRGFGAEVVGETYRRAAILDRRVGVAKTEVRVHIGLWLHDWVRGRLTEALRHADRLLAIAAEANDPALSLQAHASRGEVLMHRGELAAAFGHLKTGLEAIAGAPRLSAPVQNVAVTCAVYAAWVARLTGRDADASRFLARSRSLALLQDNPFAEAIHYAIGAATFMLVDDAPGCLDYADRAIALSREHAFVFWSGTGLVLKGWALGRGGTFDAAFEALDEGVAVFEDAGAGVQLANWHGLKAETLLAAGRPDEALETAEHALACAERAEDVFYTPRIHAVAAAAHAAEGDCAQAEARLRTAAGLARRFGMAERILALAPRG